MTGIGALYVSNNPYIGRYIEYLNRRDQETEEVEESEVVEEGETQEQTMTEQRTEEAMSFVRRPGSLLAELEEARNTPARKPINHNDPTRVEIRARCIAAALTRRNRS